MHIIKDSVRHEYGDRKPFQAQGVARASASVCSFVTILSAIKSKFLSFSFRFTWRSVIALKHQKLFCGRYRISKLLRLGNMHKVDQFTTPFQLLTTSYALFSLRPSSYMLRQIFYNGRNVCFLHLTTS